MRDLTVVARPVSGEKMTVDVCLGITNHLCKD